MLNDIVVVQSAVSAFNNAALLAPAFLWWAILMSPLFVMVYWYGNDFMARIGWGRDNLLSRISLWTSGLIFLWVIMFGGNYAVLRDDLSVLPMMTAVIVFLSSLFVSSHLRAVTLPQMNWKRWLGVLAVLIMVAMSDTHAWWGPLLQVGAFVAGAVLGRVAGGEVRPIGGGILIMLTTVLAILMQPEFFRFGQLGNLTVFHLLAILLFGIMAMGAVVTSNVCPKNKFKNSVFIKLKWLGRVVCLLGCALFLLTEAVPVLVGTLAAFAGLMTLSVVHVGNISEHLGNKLFACCLFLFGLITVMPVISAMGILYWMNTPSLSVWQESKRLL